MTHQEIIENLPAFEEGDLPASMLAAIQQHLDGCEACVAEMAAMDRAWDLIGQVPAPTIEVASDFNHRFWQRVEAEPVGWWQRWQLAVRQTLRMPVRAMAVLAVMLVILGGVIMSAIPRPPVGDDYLVPPAPEGAHYDVMGDVDVTPELDTVDDKAPAQEQPSQPKASVDDKVDQLLQELPLDAGPQS